MAKTLKWLLTFFILIIGTLLLIAAFAPYTTSTSESIVVESGVDKVYPIISNPEKLPFQHKANTHLRKSVKNERIELVEKYRFGGVNFNLEHNFEFRTQKNKTRIKWTVRNEVYFPLNIYHYFLKKELIRKQEKESKQLRKHISLAE